LDDFELSVPYDLVFERAIFRSARTTPQIRDSDSAGISAGVIQTDFDGGPIRAESEMLGPLDNHDGFFG
jgi:hypothetical protein